ncbi:phage holin family protein [Cellulosilyticum sp. I15G10I2]|uniref:phage holin family protein n=1 Tax=Cellulosilyticum sp. I15G10I2 TaxID=1892843 RepID=UPI00085C2E64|nr:phage holin family protein [Cellulosilyticum sp. I15G10I2]
MNKLFNGISILFGTTGGCIIGLLGGWDKVLMALVIFIILDYITGLLKAIYNKKLSSAIGYKGIIKKVLIFIMIVIANILQTSMGVGIPLREIVITFFACNEGLSILENASEMGLPIPEKVKDVLLQLRGNNNKGTEVK